MDVLLLGLDAHGRSFLRKHVEAHAAPKARVHFHPLEDSMPLESDRWDVIIIGGMVQSRPQLANLLKKHHLHGLKIVLTDKENLRSAMEFWGTEVYSYFLKPMNRELFQLLWQNAVERVELSKKVSHLRKEREKQRAGVLEQQEVLRDLFTSHLKMQELNQEKTNFLARTSHELLTPLTALQGYLELMANGKAGEVNDLQARVLNSSLESCRRLLRLANSLTDLVALDRNENYLQMGSGDIQECVLRSASELKAAIEGKKLILKIETDAAIPRFRFDFDRMQQVFINLLQNAMKFTPAGGTIRLRCTPHFWERRTVREMIHSSQERRGKVPSNGFNSVRVAVEDTGIGIPAEFLQEIFEEYSRVTNENGTPRGFGLGLAIARRVVLEHEGKIWAESNPGHGSCFTVLIPISL